MTSPYLFGHPIQVKPVAVKFAGLDAVAFEILSNSVAGLYLKTLPESDLGSTRSWLRKDFSGEFEIHRRRVGELNCDLCWRLFHFPAGRIFTFPFVPMPGWMVWGPPALQPADPNGDPQIVTVRVRCDECLVRIERYVSEVFQYATVRGLE